MGVFDDLDVDEVESSTTDDDQYDDPTAEGEMPDDDAAGDGRKGQTPEQRIAELERKLKEERSAGESLQARLATLETALGAIGSGGQGGSKGGDEAQKEFSLEDLKAHAEGGPTAAFEAAYALVQQENAKFRDRFMRDMEANTALEHTRQELEAILPGLGTPGSEVNAAVDRKTQEILARRPGIGKERAWELAVVSVAKGSGRPAMPENPQRHSARRRLDMSAARGAASGGDRGPTEAGSVEFTREDEEILRRLGARRPFSGDKKQRDAARQRFLAIKKRIEGRKVST